MSPPPEKPSDDEIRELVAYTAIRRLQNRYADVVTRRAWAELHELMTPRCVITVNLVNRSIDFDGPGAIGEFIGAQLEQFDFFEFVILNTVVEVRHDTGTAQARMYMQEARQKIVEGRRSDTYGVYHDELERDPNGRWWFARRRYQSYARTNPDPSPELTVFDLPEIPLGNQ